MPNAYYLVLEANRQKLTPAFRGVASSAGGQAFCQTSRPGSPVRLYFMSST